MNALVGDMYVTGEGVATSINTGWSENVAPEDCIEIPGFPPFSMRQYVKTTFSCLKHWRGMLSVMLH
jgi:hypothetical protein